MTQTPDLVAMVVEDDAIILMDLCHAVEDAGFKVREAMSGVDALRLLEKDSGIALLFTDIDMPGGMDGLELARHVSEAWPSVDILITSGRRHPSPDEMPVGAMFIGKPFSHEMVHTFLKKLLPPGKLTEQLQNR